MLSLCKENVLPRGAASLVSKKENISRWSVKRIWEKGLEPNKRSKSGRKVKWTEEIIKSRIKEVPWEKRISLRSLGHASGIPTSVLNRKIQEGLLCPSKSYLRPCLTDRHKKLRFDFVIKSLSVSEEATMIIDQFLSDSEIADILLSFQERLSSNQNNTNDTTDDSDESEEVEEGIVLASV